MDANSYYEQSLSPESALEELMQYYDTVKSVNGTLITIWHNNFLGTSQEFSGWKEAYEKFVSAIANNEPWVKLFDDFIVNKLRHGNMVINGCYNSFFVNIYLQ